MNHNHRTFFADLKSLLFKKSPSCISNNLINCYDSTENGNGREDALRIKIESILMYSAGFWTFIIFICGIVLNDPKYEETTITIVGAFSVVGSLVFYGAPLMNMVEIVRTKDSSSLYVPALLINGVSCTLWFFYVLLGVYAVIVWLPNIIGLGLVAVELGMCFMYPAKMSKGIGSVNKDEPLSEYAVYSSSRHMSNADLIFPNMISARFSAKSQKMATINENDQSSRMKGSLEKIPQVEEQNPMWAEKYDNQTD